MKKNNPFTLTFGKEPNEYISRYENTEAIISTFDSENPVSQAYLIEGVRGSGKTVLMTKIASELQETGRWLVIDLNSTKDLVDDLAMRLLDATRKNLDVLKQGFNVSAAGFGIGINGQPSAGDSISVIEDALAEIKKKNKRVIITIDEVMHNDNMRRFASQFQILVRKDFPVFLLMTGLYENIYAIQNDPALTFLLRTPKICLEPLSMHQIIKQYSRIFDISSEEATGLARLTKGYAFAFQALGMLFYEYRDELKTPDIVSKLEDMLDDFVYKKIWESLSQNERRLLLAITEDEIRVRDLCDKTSMTQESFSKYRSNLIKRGIITSPRHGYVALALPLFGEVIKSYV